MRPATSTTTEATASMTPGSTFRVGAWVQRPTCKRNPKRQPGCTGVILSLGPLRQKGQKKGEPDLVEVLTVSVLHLSLNPPELKVFDRVRLKCDYLLPFHGTLTCRGADLEHRFLEALAMAAEDEQALFTPSFTAVANAVEVTSAGEAPSSKFSSILEKGGTSVCSIAGAAEVSASAPNSIAGAVEVSASGETTAGSDTEASLAGDVARPVADAVEVSAGGAKPSNKFLSTLEHCHYAVRSIAGAVEVSASDETTAGSDTAASLARDAARPVAEVSAAGATPSNKFSSSLEHCRYTALSIAGAAEVSASGETTAGSDTAASLARDAARPVADAVDMGQLQAKRLTL
eukprot:TRINITY_DN5484_c0_g1_i4.p1 TRINITY_DN5484_c0_g1~~TRINITY_DN5484_c0_g1_i4.p1  ORF type:complete len:346 (-),score=40.31 TRINITY_DN5484_c0_g1_i4:215-1252(-)